MKGRNTCIKEATNGKYYLCACPACQEEKATAPQRFKSTIKAFWTDNYNRIDKEQAQNFFYAGHESDREVKQ